MGLISIEHNGVTLHIRYSMTNRKLKKFSIKSIKLKDGKKEFALSQLHKDVYRNIQRTIIKKERKPK